MPRDVAGVLLAGGLSRRMGGGDKACAASGGRHHPVFGLWPVRPAGAAA